MDKKPFLNEQNLDNKFYPSKRLGQNFLINRDIQKKIIISAHLQKNDYVLEIGPGMGALTGIILSYPVKLFAIEFDKRLYENLKIKFSSYQNFQLLQADAIVLDWNTFLFDNSQRDWKLVANLPYSISSLLVLKIIEAQPIKQATIMVQKEMALRLSAHVGTKDYGSLSVLTQLFFQVNILFDVGHQNFKPQPKVTSSVINMTRINFDLNDNQMQKLKKFLYYCFANRRKTLVNNLQAYYDKQLLLGLLSQFDLNPLVRAEQIDPHTLLAIMNELNNAKSV